MKNINIFRTISLLLFAIWGTDRSVLAQTASGSAQRQPIPESQIQMPEFYGFYAVDGGKTIQWPQGPLPRFSSSAEFLLFHNGVAFAVVTLYRVPNTPPQRAPTKNDGRFSWDKFSKSADDFFLDNQAALSGIPRGAITVELRRKPVTGQPEMIRFMPATNLESGLYQFNIEDTIYRFIVDQGRPGIVSAKSIPPKSRGVRGAQPSRAESRIDVPLKYRLEAVCPDAKIGQFRHGTKYTGLYDLDEGKKLRLVDIRVVGESSEKAFTKARSLVHPGIDLPASEGANVYSIADGTVDDLVMSSGDADFPALGYTVIVEHAEQIGGKPIYGLYLHLNAPPKVEIGQKVKAGETLLGHVGKTGVAFGPHLHFELRHFSNRFFPKWGNIYGVERPKEEATFNEKEFAENWIDPETFLKSPNTESISNTLTAHPISDSASADEIIRLGIEALGGHDKLAKKTSWHATSVGRTFASADEMPYEVEQYFNHPNQVREEMTFESDGRKFTQISTFDGRTGWKSVNGKIEKQDSHSLQTQTDRLYLIEVLGLTALLSQPYSVSREGDTSFDSRPVAVVRVSAKGRSDVMLFCDKETALVVKSQTRARTGRNNQRDPITEDFVFSDFREIDGIIRAMRIEQFKDGIKSAESETQSVSFTDALDPNLFRKP